MDSKLRDQLKMSVPFDSLETEVFLNLSRTYSTLSSIAERVFKDHGITSVQYNVLRILRGAGEEGLPCLEISSRMVTRVPDITRLVDRLVKMELVTRERGVKDRRVVNVKLADKGLQIIEQIDEPLKQNHKDLFSHMNEEQLRTLIHLLEEARNE